MGLGELLGSAPALSLAIRDAVLPARNVRARLVIDRDHYEYLVKEAIASAKVSVWIGTANVKGMMVEAPIGTRARARGRYMSILDTLDALARKGADLRLLHAGEPSRAFRTELARHPALKRGGLQIRRCPRVHLKLIAIDGKMLYLGSANFTGAGLGAKGDGRRNFEMGMLTDDDVMLDAAQERFDSIWSGRECKGCKLRSVCPKPLDTPSKKA
jgi:phosphatidylserine/phosphatidylglycerophosphate/cardiolipin synthase-like enzyme